MPTKQSKKQPKKRSVKVTSRSKIRIRPVGHHRSLRLSKKHHVATKPLPGVKSLVATAFATFWKNKKIYISITIIYAILQFVFTKGFGTSFDIAQSKSQLEDYLGEPDRSLGTSYALFNHMLESFNSSVSQTAGTYQLFITVIIILAVIWLSRQIFSGEKPRIRDGFYKGMYPLIPFILVMAVISLQLIPALLGNFIFSAVIANGLAVTFLEKFLWFLLFLVLLVLSLYMILSSIFALNIVTLPDVGPMQALRSARDLVLHRRIGIFARILILPVIGFIIAAAIFIPLLIFAAIVVEPLFLLYSSFVVVLMTIYMYNFYRKLL